jgi:hypothetical protein
MANPHPFRCPGCGKVELASDDRITFGDSGMVLNFPVSPPRGWKTQNLWGQSPTTGHVRSLTISCCSHECWKTCASGKAEPWAEDAIKLLDQWIERGT